MKLICRKALEMLATAVATTAVAKIAEQTAVAQQAAAKRCRCRPGHRTMPNALTFDDYLDRPENGDTGAGRPGARGRKSEGFHKTVEL
jgi:hypothetical protein